MSRLTKEQKKELDQFVGYAVKNGALDEDTARKMSYQDKLEYQGWSEFKANSEDKMPLDNA